MYYVLYLASLCKRRHWPDPLYVSHPNTTTTSTSSTSPEIHGYTCTVRVNNREYQTDTACASELLARENAAMRAYLICRNFSVNDGMYVREGEGVQGIPVAIGTGRKQRGLLHAQVRGRARDADCASSPGGSASVSVSSPGTSPGGSGSGSGSGSSGGSSPEFQYQVSRGYGYGF